LHFDADVVALTLPDGRGPSGEGRDGAWKGFSIRRRAQVWFPSGTMSEDSTSMLVERFSAILNRESRRQALRLARADIRKAAMNTLLLVPFILISD